MGSLRTAGLFLVAVALAAALRFPLLAQRPMHCDESVLAAKTGILLDQGRYEYDPNEFHGPTLHFLTLISARIQGAARYVDINETTLRMVPAVFGLLLVAAHFLVTPVLGRSAAVTAALLAAISPGMVFYSRYYIHETSFVFFSFGALISTCRYLRKPSAGWAITAGACLGLMHATKETSVIVFFSLSLALILTLAFEKWRGESPTTPGILNHGRHLLLAFVAAGLTSVVLFSSFLSHPRGIVDSLLAYRTYVERATEASLHTHPWDYYLDMLLYFRLDSGPVWTEGLIVALAIFGFASGFSRDGAVKMGHRLLRFIGIYTLLMTVLYSAIPYKTPWCALGFLHGMILLAGAGAVSIFHACRKPALQGLFLILITAAAAHLGWQAWRGSFRLDADPGNPYVYAHTTRDVFVIARQVEALARAHPDGMAMPIQIISRENLWPLPWYLRRFANIGWWNGVSDDARKAPLILATPDMEPVLARKLYELPPPGERELYMNIFDRKIELRPQVEIRGYAAKTLWDAYRQQQARDEMPPGAQR
jgi:uncharacterized protein (TIGR03663 family)